MGSWSAGELILFDFSYIKVSDSIGSRDSTGKEEKRMAGLGHNAPKTLS
jgi:hypothetical protein